jgi:hypothetical protein
MPWARLITVSLIGLAWFEGEGIAGQVDTGAYLRLQKGMSEGEVLFRLGPPDKEVYFDSEAQRTPQSIKQFLYIPGPEAADPHLTIITIQQGKILNIERIKLLFSPSESKGGQLDFEIYMHLALGMPEGEVLVRAGEPDREVYIGGSMKQLLYIPSHDESDPHITIITTTNGEVTNIERTKLFSR